jgi:hypothetical protein
MDRYVPHNAFDALRQDAALAATVARAEGVTHTARHLDAVQAGDFAAVTRAGDVFRLNPTALDFEEAEQRLADTQPRMASVVEARAVNEISREQRAELSAQRRDDNTAARVAHSDAFEAQREMRDAVRTTEHETRAMIETAEETVDRGLNVVGRFLGGAVKVVEMAYGLLFGWAMAEPRLTPDQAERKERADEERAEARADHAAQQERSSDIDRLIAEMQRQQQQSDAEAPPRRPPERDDDRGYERER